MGLMAHHETLWEEEDGEFTQNAMPKQKNIAMRLVTRDSWLIMSRRNHVDSWWDSVCGWDSDDDSTQFYITHHWHTVDDLLLWEHFRSDGGTFKTNPLSVSNLKNVRGAKI
jgi:hypothetical protein